MAAGATVPSPVRIIIVSVCVLVFTAMVCKMLRGLRESFVVQAPPAYNVVVAQPREARVAPASQVLAAAADTRVVAPTDAHNPELPAPINAVDDPDALINQLDLGRCSADCCGLGKGTNLSCAGGCVCYNAKNNAVLATRGGNKHDTPDADEF